MTWYTVQVQGDRMAGSTSMTGTWREPCPILDRDDCEHEVIAHSSGSGLTITVEDRLVTLAPLVTVSPFRLEDPREPRTSAELEAARHAAIVGYGRAMQMAAYLWQMAAVDCGVPGSEFRVGPCAGMTVACPCPAGGRDPDGHCTWCCGAGWVTERVARAIADDTKYRTLREDLRAEVADFFALAGR